MNFPTLHYFAPHLLLSVAAGVLLLMETMKSASSDQGRRLSWLVSFATVVAAVLMIPGLPGAAVSFGRGMLVWDGLSLLVTWVGLIGAGLTLMLTVSGGRQGTPHLHVYLALVLLSVVGTLFVGASQNFLMVFIAIELTSLPSFVLVGYTKACQESLKAALQFFLMGAFASALLIYGASLIYGLTGSLNMGALLSDQMVLQPKMPLVLTALLFVLVGLSFKMALVPFQWWLPEAFAGAPTPIAAYLSVIPKIAGLIFLLRLSATQSLLLGDPLFIAVAVLAAITMTFGNILGLLQTNVLRLLAYSSVSHMGFLLLGVLSGLLNGFPAIAFYAVAYLFMNFGVFAVIGLVIRHEGRSDLDAFFGLSQRSPMAAALLAVFVVSLAGLPPLSGFMAKFYILSQAYQAGWSKLVLLGLVNAVISCAYYFKILYAMYFQPPTSTEPIRIGVSDRLVLAAASFFTLGMGIFPEFFLRCAKHLLP